VTNPTLQAQVDAANAYESLFVPALFSQWAPMVADAARIQPGDRVLDVACGTGVLAREAARRTGPAGYVAGVDANPGMLEVARALAPSTDWHQGVAESLPFPDASFDVVISQFGLMFFSDRRQAVREMLRVLTPGGRLAVAVWDALDHSPAYAAEVALVERLAGEQAADALRAPFVLGDRIRLASLFVEAGVGAVEVTTHPGTANFPSIRVMVEADLRGWLPVMGVVLDEDQIERILAEAGRDLSPFLTAAGTVAFECPAHLVTGTRS
jgi:SAM-dependent methyltransferase